MTTCRYRFRRGLTLIELLMATLAAVIVILGSAAILVGAHLGYHRLYRRINGWEVAGRSMGIVRNAYEARLTFDRIIRSSDTGYAFFGASELWIYYYTAPSVDTLVALVRPNRYAHFRLEVDELVLYRGDVGPSHDLHTLPPPQNEIRQVLASNVTSCQFTPVGLGAGIRMVLTLDNETSPDSGRTKLETSTNTVSTTAIRHNNELQVGP